MITQNQNIKVQNTTISLCIKREDLIHKFVSGNKFRKLKYNIIQAKKENQNTILTFGGAFSNHIAAVAYAGKIHNIKTIGIIRGEELEIKINSNPTLSFAQQNGMQLKFISRTSYKLKTNLDFLNQLESEFGNFYLLPEGGTNNLAVKGCEEILTKHDSEFDYICCCVGTGGTIAGIINSALPHQKIIGFSAMKGDFLNDEIRKFATNKNWKLIDWYDFGGYGKVNTNLITFINQFYLDYGIPLDPVYTGKMAFGIMDLIQKNYFPEHSKILMIHSGGLQGIKGMNLKLTKKKLLTIDFNV